MNHRRLGGIDLGIASAHTVRLRRIGWHRPSGPASSTTTSTTPPLPSSSTSVAEGCRCTTSST